MMEVEQQQQSLYESSSARTHSDVAHGHGHQAAATICSKPVHDARTETVPKETVSESDHLEAKILVDRSLYRGQTDSDGQPHGLGVVYAALATDQYTGGFCSGTKSGLGVHLLPNGTLCAGEFNDGYACGYGVKRDPFGNQYIGQWREGELDGHGMAISVDGATTWGHFQLNELADIGGTATCAQWVQVEGHVHRALLAEQGALQQQERVREIERQLLMETITAINGKSFSTTEAISMVEEQEDAVLQLFLTDNQQQLRDVEKDADKWKLTEAELKETQKKMRHEINAKRNELSFLAKFVGLADERRGQLRHAERTLQLLQQQIANLEKEEDEKSTGTI